MTKKYKLLDHVNNRRVISIFLDHPEDYLTTYEVVDRLRRFTGSSEIGDSLVELSKAELLIKKPKKPKGKKYRIASRSDAFEAIFYGYCSYNSEKLGRLLRSEYTNYMIKKRGIKKIHEIIKPEFNDPKFRTIASVLLDLSATHKEYKLFADTLQETISQVNIKKYDTGTKGRKQDALYEIGDELCPKEIDEIDLLNDFEPATAIRFYRNHINKSVIAGLGKLRERNVISEGLHDFLIFDNYLSPLSSYPVNGTLQLLFAQPFQRIYEDIYLLDGEAFELMSSRAAVIYSNFSDILFELFRNSQLDEKSVNTRTKEMIFHWNVSSTRFDLICNQFARFYKEKENYHLGTDGLNYRITDLGNTSRQLLPEHVSKSILVEGSGPLVFEEVDATKFKAKPMENPFTILRPCLVFKDMNWRNDFISIEEILNDLKTKCQNIIEKN